MAERQHARRGRPRDRTDRARRPRHRRHDPDRRSDPDTRHPIAGRCCRIGRRSATWSSGRPACCPASANRGMSPSPSMVRCCSRSISGASNLVQLAHGEGLLGGAYAAHLRRHRDGSAGCAHPNLKPIGYWRLRAAPLALVRKHPGSDGMFLNSMVSVASYARIYSPIQVATSPVTEAGTSHATRMLARGRASGTCKGWRRVSKRG